MNEKGFVAYLFRVMLEEHFKTKAAMARALDMSLQTLRLNFKNLERAKGGTMAFEKLVFYCCHNDIDILIAYHRYVDETATHKKGGLLLKYNKLFEYFCINVRMQHNSFIDNIRSIFDDTAEIEYCALGIQLCA